MGSDKTKAQAVARILNARLAHDTDLVARVMGTEGIALKHAAKVFLEERVDALPYRSSAMSR